MALATVPMRMMMRMMMRRRMVLLLVRALLSCGYEMHVVRLGLHGCMYDVLRANLLW